MTVNSKIQR